ncbi:phosphatase PAP2 family protein [Rhizobium leguminosarum]|uniref:Phosphoesterase n=1 Tax=Rhizobium leguminosarum TaxID=384 RepID=A0A1B1C8F9_RHILE|nr:phosphatase PAP2 family protein [Rhizobium leguminosarum]ANP86027.1 phosphoesterase [Rhizobium leguminosarum]
MYELDVWMTQAINGLAGRNGLADQFMVLVSSIGVPLLVLAVAVQWWRKSDRLYIRHVLVAAGLSFLLGLGVNQIILLFLSRIRPYDGGITHLIIERSADPSFPSDHATATFAVAAAFLFHGMERRGLAFLSAAILVAFSRVYIGTHYASDVLGGALTGILAAGTIVVFYKPGTRVDRMVTGIL